MGAGYRCVDTYGIAHLNEYPYVGKMASVCPLNDKKNYKDGHIKSIESWTNRNTGAAMMKAMLQDGPVSH